MKKISNQSKDIYDLLLNIIDNIALNRKIAEREFDKLTKYLEYSNKSVALLKLVSCFKSLYQTFSKHKIEIDNQILYFLSEIKECLKYLQKEDYFVLNNKAKNLQKELIKVKKESSLLNENFIENIKFDRIYSEVDEILLAFEEISSEIEKNRRKL